MAKNKNTGTSKETGTSDASEKLKTTIDESKGTVTVELPYLGRRDQAFFDRGDDYSTEYGGGSSVFKSRSYSHAKSKMSKAQDYFLKDSLARRIIELMAQFSATPVQLKGPQKHKAFFQQWLKVIGMTSILKKIFKEFYRSSNVHIIKCNLPLKGKVKQNEKLSLDLLKGFKMDGRLGNNDISEYKKNLASKIKEGEFLDEAARKLNWTNKMVPWRYTVLNPLQIEKYGDSTFDLEEIYWTPSHSLRNLILKINNEKETARKLQPIINSLPVMLYQQLKDGKARVELYSHYHSSIYRMKDDSEPYAEPLMTPIFDHLFRKNQMREADIRVIKSVINKILLITVGSDKFPAKLEQLQAISTIFQEPSNVLELIWNHAIDIKWIDVNTEFLDPAKYKSVDRDIKEGFGVTEILLGTTDENRGNPFVSLRGLVENMADGQEEVSKWLQQEFEEIGAALQLDNVPEPHLTTINLEDKVSLFKIYQGMVDRGVLSNQTVCELMGDDWRRNIEQIKKESKLREEGTLPMIGSPYQKGAGNPSASEPGTPAGSTPQMTPGEIKGSQGKPPGQQGPLETPRKTPRVKNAARAELDVLLKRAAEVAALDEGQGMTTDELKTYARQAMRKLYTEYTAGGKPPNDAYTEAAINMYKIPAKDISRFVSGTYTPNGSVDLNSNIHKNMIADIRTMAENYSTKWKRDNAGENLTMDIALDIFADSWASCVPV